MSVWQLQRGDLFRIPGSPVILEFHRMDGFYGRAFTRTGQLWIGAGHVELLEGR